MAAQRANALSIQRGGKERKQSIVSPRREKPKKRKVTNVDLAA